MPDLKSLDNVYMVLGLIVPGLIIVFIRSRFMTGRIPPHSEAILSYLTLSVIYYALVAPFAKFVISINEPGYEKVFAWFFLVFIGPSFLGVALGKISNSVWFETLLNKCGLHVVHVVPTAWDWKFYRVTPQWVLVTLKNGDQIAGYLGSNSFISSDPKERDICIERIYGLDENNVWTDRGPTGILIGANEIHTIEFWPIERTINEQGKHEGHGQ